MIEFEKACEIALQHYEKKLGINGIYSPYDIGDAWVFNGGREDEGRVGIQKIAVSKDNGEVSTFNLPSPKNFALLDAGVALELPEKYR
ncbi:MAG: hypothetical protein IJ087_09125 [Eggerthellaceae bacterium]|nr:hypothetical protein [Eggerthellaceae bacterium]